MARIAKKQTFQMPLNSGSINMGRLEVEYIEYGPGKDIDLNQVKYYKSKDDWYGQVLNWDMLESSLFDGIVDEIYNAAKEHAADTRHEEIAA